MAMNAAHHANVVMIGCCNGGGTDPVAGMAFPKSSRSEDTRALIGFHSAMTRNHVGIPAGSTKMLESMATGKVRGISAVRGRRILD